MKYLSVPRLDVLSSLLSSCDLGDRLIHGRVEAYSCKAAGEDKRLSKHLERQLTNELSQSPSPILHSSPLGPLDQSSTRKLLISLISTLNASFPDYDFSNLRAEQFDRELVPTLAVTNINSLLLNSLDSFCSAGIKGEFWSAITETIDGIDACEVYSYTPEVDSELTQGKLWAIYYFFYNKKQKKIVFFTADAVSKMHGNQDGDGDDGIDEDLDLDSEVDAHRDGNGDGSGNGNGNRIEFGEFDSIEMEMEMGGSMMLDGSRSAGGMETEIECSPVVRIAPVGQRDNKTYSNTLDHQYRLNSPPISTIGITSPSSSTFSSSSSSSSSTSSSSSFDSDSSSDSTFTSTANPSPSSNPSTKKQTRCKSSKPVTNSTACAISRKD